MEEKGDLRGALGFCANMAGMLPDFGYAHWRMSRILARMGRRAEAAREGAIANRLGIGAGGMPLSRRRRSPI
jgi:hypothetical protein